MGGHRVKKTREQFIEESKRIHGDKYDYSNVFYVNNRTKVCIVCRKHGEFWQDAGGHLKGYGCKECGIEKKKSHHLVSGVGINDCEDRTSVNGKEIKSYQAWRNMLARCYCENSRSRYKTYERCDVCEEWKIFSNFKKWFDENYVEGYDMDKDLLSPNNKLYSAETCIFIPHRLNTLFREVNIAKECQSIGVVLNKASNKYKYKAVVCKNGRAKRVGNFNTEEEAHQVYINEKIKEVKKIATEYYERGEIDSIIYNAVMNYKVE